jgi:hypothetical protein
MRPLAGLNSIFNKGQSIDSGFAVNAWRLNEFMTGTNAVTNAALGDVFAGVPGRCRGARHGRLAAPCQLPHHHRRQIAFGQVVIS